MNERSDENVEKAVLSPEREEEREKKKSRGKKIFGYVLFIVVSAAVILGMVLFEDRSGDMADWVLVWSRIEKNPGWTVAAFACFFLIVVSDALVFYGLSKRIGSKRTHSVCLKTALFGRYFDRITPWSTGGEPFQIVYLTKTGMSTADAGAVSVSRHIIRFFATAIVVICILAFSHLAANIYVMIAAIAGLAIGLVVPIFMLICAFRPRVGRKISDFLIRLLYKMKIVKDREKAEEKVGKKVENFLSGVQFLSKHKGMILLIAFGAMVELFATQSVPFFVMKSLGVEGVTYWHTLVLCLYVNYAAGFAPTPGGSGLAEVSFYAIFDAFVTGGMLFWSVLIWRIAVFYVPVFIGFILQLVTSVRQIVRVRRS